MPNLHLDHKFSDCQCCPVNQIEVSVLQWNSGSEVCWLKPFLRRIPRLIPFAVSYLPHWCVKSWRAALGFAMPCALAAHRKCELFAPFQFLYILTLAFSRCRQAEPWEMDFSILSFDFLGGKNDPVTLWTLSLAENGSLSLCVEWTMPFLPEGDGDLAKLDTQFPNGVIN